MASFAQAAACRRKFLQFLAASPLLAAGGAWAGDAPTPGAKLPDPLMWAPMRADDRLRRAIRHSETSGTENGHLLKRRSP